MSDTYTSFKRICHIHKAKRLLEQHTNRAKKESQRTSVLLSLTSEEIAQEAISFSAQLRNTHISNSLE